MVHLGALSHLRTRVYALRSRLLFRPYVASLEVEGHRIQFLIGDRVGRDWYTREDWTTFAQLRWLLDRMVAPGDIVIDCEAHHGLFGVILAKKVGRNGSIYCVEAHPGNVAILRENVELNKLQNVYIIHAAVGKENGAVHIRNWSNSALMSREDCWPSIEVPMRTIDSIANETGISPDLLMIDVEGVEANVLTGAKRTLEHRPKLAIEVHYEEAKRYGIDSNSLFEFIPDDYEIYTQVDDRRGPVTKRNSPFTIDRRMQLYAIPQSAK